jgi:hypothetical protein
MADRRMVTLSGYRQALKIVHAHFPREERVEDVPVRHEIVHLDVRVSWAVDGQEPTLDRCWNYAPLVAWLQAREGGVLTETLESFADAVLGVALRIAVERHLSDVRVEIELERPGLIPEAVIRILRTGGMP